MTPQKRRRERNILLIIIGVLLAAMWGAYRFFFP